MRRSGPVLIKIVYLLFTVSGFIGLTYEALWARYLKLLLGHSAYGQILTLVIYMGGLGIGSFIGGRASKKFKNPFFLYAGTELLVGMCGILYHTVYLAATSGYYHLVFFKDAGPIVNLIAKVIIAAVITSPGAILLGMTFPAIAVALMRYQKDSGKKTLPYLYFFNSLGAAAGIACTTYFTIAHLGTDGALKMAGFANIFLAIGFYLIARATSLSDTMGSAQHTAHPIVSSPAIVAWLLLSALTGFSSFLYEIGWIRLISLLLGSSTHSFDIMISAFILGLAFGGLYSNKILTMNKNIPWALGSVQILMGVFALCSIYLYKPFFTIINNFHQVFSRTEVAYGVTAVAKYLFCLLLMGPTTFFAGMTLPLITFWLLQRTADEKYTGSVYGWNTVGSIVGACAGGLVILPLCQLKYTLGIGAVIDIALGLFIFALYDSGKRRFTATAIAASVAVVPLFIMHFDSALLNEGVFRNYIAAARPAKKNNDRHVTVRDGRTATISFEQTPDRRTIKTNGKTDASITIKNGKVQMVFDEPTQASVAFYPMSIFNRPYNAAIIGMGSGRTAHHLLSDPLVTSVEIVEIEPEMVRLARGFLPFNRRAYEDPRAKIVIDDAKTYFFVNDKSYDLIISEPSNPWVSGVSSLFTIEFYRHITSFLKPGGVLVQWLHLYEFNSDLLLTIIKSMDAVFPCIKMYAVPGTGGALTDIVLIAGSHDFALSFLDRFHTTPSIQADLAEIETDPSFFGPQNYILSSATIRPLLESYRPNSDFNQFVDNGAEKAFFLKRFADLFVPFTSTVSYYQELTEPNACADMVRAKNKIKKESFSRHPSMKFLECLIAQTDSSTNWNVIDTVLYPPLLPYACPEVWSMSRAIDDYRKKCAQTSVPQKNRIRFQFLDAVMRSDRETTVRLLHSLPEICTPEDMWVDFIRTAMIEAVRSSDTVLAQRVYDRFVKGNPRLTPYEIMLSRNLIDRMSKPKP
jgi:spermidine synthase